MLRIVRGMSLILAAGVFLAFAVFPVAARGQGLLVNVEPDQRAPLPRPIIIWPPHSIPRPQPTPPPSSYKVKELAVNATLVDQVARVQVSQSFVNTGSRQMEVCFVFPLPHDGAIDQLTLLVDGKEYPAKLLDAKEARRQYEEIVRKNQDPALLEWIGTGMFRTSVFPVPPGAERKVTLRYSQLCRKADGLTDFLFPLSTAKYTSHPVEEVKFQLTIESQADIKNIYSPSHTVEIKRPDNKHATINYTGKNEIPTADFRLLYDVGAGQVGTSVLSYRPKSDDDGYFLLLASPEIKAAASMHTPKTVLFVVDRSGSMSGEKIEQAKGALKFVLNNLREGDLFNVIAYDSEVQTWRPELQKFSDETRQAALGFVEGIYAGGSTNIRGALVGAMGQLQDSSRPNFIIFLTDGLPTVGETNEAKTVADVEQHNRVRARLFAFGVGYDLNSRLLDKLVRSNYGQSEYVRPNEDIEAHVSALYNRIGSPVMTDLAIKFDLEGLTTADGEPVNRVYPKEAHDLFAGEQLVIVGRYRKPGAAKVVVTGKVGGSEQRFDFPATLVEKSSDESSAFVEKLWAVRRVGEILDELDLKGQNDELVKELVTLATQHGILTPYTSFLADENTNLRDLAGAARETGERLGRLNEIEGKSGVAQRRIKGFLQRSAAPASEGLRGGADGQTFDAFSEALDEKQKGDADKVVENVRQVGRKTFYRRGDGWLDAEVTEEQQQKPITVKRFSQEYFDLADELGRDAAKYLAFDEPVTVEFNGQAYQVE